MKLTEIKITCDSCCKDISPKVTGYEADYILQVSAINVAMHDGNAIYAMAIYPPIDNDLYFCGISCMKSYGDKKESK